MDLQQLSASYAVRRLTEADIPAILALQTGNPQFFRYHPPLPSEASIREDLSALPPEKTAADKYYAGFFSGEQLIAVLDLILGYPDARTAFLGFFMTAAAVQKKGVGSAIISDIRACCKRLGFARLCLAIDEGNPQSEAFWTKNGFRQTGERRPNGAYAYLPMELPL